MPTKQSSSMLLFGVFEVSRSRNGWQSCPILSLPFFLSLRGSDSVLCDRGNRLPLLSHCEAMPLPFMAVAIAFNVLSFLVFASILSLRTSVVSRSREPKAWWEAISPFIVFFSILLFSKIVKRA